MSRCDFRIVQELAAIGKAVGRNVEDAHDLRLIQPHGTRAADKWRRDPLEVLKLHLQFG